MMFKPGAAGLAAIFGGTEQHHLFNGISLVLQLQCVVTTASQCALLIGTQLDLGVPHLIVILNVYGIGHFSLPLCQIKTVSQTSVIGYCLESNTIIIITHPLTVSLWWIKITTSFLFNKQPQWQHSNFQKRQTCHNTCISWKDRGENWKNFADQSKFFEAPWTTLYVFQIKAQTLFFLWHF